MVAPIANPCNFIDKTSGGQDLRHKKLPPVLETARESAFEER